MFQRLKLLQSYIFIERYYIASSFIRYNLVLLLTTTLHLFIITSCAKPTPVNSWYDPEKTPLIETTFQAARSTKSKDSEVYIEQAEELIEQGTDVNEQGTDGRTALHWVVIGAILSSDKKLDEQYWHLAERLIHEGADVNATDDYGNTPLDWKEIGTGDDILELLISNGAENGIGKDGISRLKILTEKLYLALDNNDRDLARAIIEGDIRVGTEIPIRLTTTVSSQLSRSGDPVEAVVIAPVRVGDRIVIPPGTKVEGTVLFSEPVRDQYDQAQLMLDFANLVHPSGKKTQIFTLLSEVKNAKETVDRNRIVGTRFKTSNNIISWANRVLGWITPSSGVALESILYGYGRTVDRKIEYNPGVEMVLVVAFPERLNEIPDYEGWPEFEPSDELINIINEQPVQVMTKKKEFSDITNVMLIGSQEEILDAFNSASWVEADKINVKSGLTSFFKFMTDRGFETGPFSGKCFDANTCDGADLELQKSNNTFAKRHHIRLWKLQQLYEGKEIWVGGATHDIGYGVAGKSMIHIIDRRVDRERDKIRDDLMFTELPFAYSLIPRNQLPNDSNRVQAASMGGTTLITDGRMLVILFD